MLRILCWTSLSRGSNHTCVMKCENCGGPLEGIVNYCPFCGAKQEVDLKQVNYRDVGTDESLPCPHCKTALGVIEFDAPETIRVGRCGTCMGTFFNPGKLEAFLNSQTTSLVWLDKEQLNELSAQVGENDGIIYRKCPVCTEPMSPSNFGGHSGVIIDSCAPHGNWLKGGDLRRISEWWRAGGELIYKQHEEERTKVLYGREARPLPEIEHDSTVNSIRF